MGMTMSKRITLKRLRTGEYAGDLVRIQTALIASGYQASLSDCQLLWEKYSDSMAAGWLFLPESDAEIVDCVSPYFDVDDE
jgi:hypothetical protein